MMDEESFQIYFPFLEKKGGVSLIWLFSQAYIDGRK